MATVRLLNGPCDPRDVEMSVTTDASHVFIRPMPFDCQDVYAVTDKFIDGEVVTHATGEYLFTTGTRRQRDLYRKQLLTFGTARAFLIKSEAHARVH